MGRLLLRMTPLLFLALTAATPAGQGISPPRPAVRIGTASVTIIQAERIVVEQTPSDPPKQDRQIRKREDKPLVEFY